MKKVLILLFTTLTFFYNTNAQIDLTPALPGPNFYGADVGDVMLADLDNDGDKDFISIGTGTGSGTRTTIFMNDGFGNFTEVMGDPLVDVGNGVIELGDVNGDGFLDIYIQASTSGGIKTANLYMNDGTGAFTLSTGQPFGERSGGDAAFGDIDDDDDLDLITTGILGNFDDPFTTLFINDGFGNFSEVTGTPFEALTLSSVEFVDIDGSGDLAIILLGENTNGNRSTTFYMNDGAGNFTQVTDSFKDFSGGEIAIGDSDNDGDLDILLSGSTNSSDLTELYLNDGLGNFTLNTATMLPGSFVGETKFADFDNDGDLDVMISGVSTDVIADIYENIGGNNFVLADKLGKAYISCFAIGDIDGDTDLDAIIGGTSFTSPVRDTKTYLNTMFNDAELLLDFDCMTLTHNSPANPFVIEGGISDYTIEILDASETVIQTITPTSSKVSIEITILPAGIHFVRVVNSSNNLVFIQHMIKE